MMKWAVIGQQVLERRYKILSEFLRQKGIENELSLIEATQDNFSEVLESTMKTANHIRIESPFREVILNQFKNHPLLVNSIGAADCLIQREGKWWPETSLFYAFNELFSRYGEKLDLNGEVLVVGGGAGAKFAVASALRAGFSRINVTTKFDDQGISLVSDFKRRYFSVNFEFIPQDRLVLLPGTNALLINTTPLVPSNDLLAELHYLNFLRQDGMIWDLVTIPATTPLIREGEQINIKCVRGREVAAISDQAWLAWALPQPPSMDELVKQYNDAFDDQPSVAVKGEDPSKSRTLA